MVSVIFLSLLLLISDPCIQPGRVSFNAHDLFDKVTKHHVLVITYTYTIAERLGFYVRL